MSLEKIPIIGSITQFLDGEGIDYGFPVLLIGLLFIFFGFNFIGLPQSQIVSFVFMLMPIWLPIATFLIFFEVYMQMVGKKFELESGRVVLEIILPPEVYKSPEAMEYVFTQIWNPANPDNLMDTYLSGKKPLTYTFELVSRGGDVHFYATMPKKFMQGFTDAMYSQYPAVEIVKQEVDYTAEISKKLKGLTFMSFHVQKKKDSKYPIKTYIDFDMDKLPKEEQKLDPMTPMLEVLAGIKPHQQVWVQFLCTAHREEGFKLGQLRKKDTWEKDVYTEIDKIMMRDSKTKTGDVDLDGMPRITTGERDKIEVMERNVGKTAYKFASRFIYISNKENDFEGGLFARMIRSFSQTELKGRNGLGVRWRTDYNYKMISDPFGKKIPALKKEELKEYKLRKLSVKSNAMSFKIMTVEELATLFHLPGSVAGMTTLNRVTSTRRDSPSNLPVGNLPT